MTVQLNLRDVAAAARAALKAGTLSAQAPKPACQYRMRGGYRCAIGAALSDKDCATLRRKNPSDGHATFNTRTLASLTGWDSDNREGVKRLQGLHDAWANALGGHAKAGARRAFAHKLYSILGREA